MQHNKQREELHRLQDRHPKEAAKAAQRVSAQQPSEAEEESSEEDEVCNDLSFLCNAYRLWNYDSASIMLLTSTTCLYCLEWAHCLKTKYAECVQDDGYIPNAVEKQIFETMLKIRKRDSSIYDSKKHFFADASDVEQPHQDGRATKKSKPMLLKDVIAQQVIKHVPCQVCAVCLDKPVVFCVLLLRTGQTICLLQRFLLEERCMLASVLTRCVLCKIQWQI